MKHETPLDIIWAPWRMEYIVSEISEKSSSIVNDEHTLNFEPDADPECFICQGVADTDDKKRLLVRRTEKTVTILNRFPYNNGHLLVAPKRHVGKLQLLSNDEKSELLHEIDRWVEIIEQTMNPGGFNIGLNLGRTAGAGLPGHLHWHIVPRWDGDTNFMTSISSVKVIPQSLESLWELLRQK